MRTDRFESKPKESALNDLIPADHDWPSTPNHPSKLTPQPIDLNPRALARPGALPVSSLLYSGFIEHIGRCIYGGVCDDPGNPSPKELLLDQGDFPGGRGKKRLGLRKEVLDVWGKDGDLQCSLMRWPGGE